MTERVIIDTGPLVAILCEGDGCHKRCVSALKSIKFPLLTCWPVLTEAAWLLRSHPHDMQRLLESVQAGLLELLSLEADDLLAIAAIMKRYEDLGLQLADAAIVHLAEREGIRTVFTIDRRDFSIVRLKRNRSLRLIPEMT